MQANLHSQQLHLALVSRAEQLSACLRPAHHSVSKEGQVSMTI